MRNSVLEIIKSLYVFEIAYMLADKNTSFFSQGDGVL